MTSRSMANRIPAAASTCSAPQEPGLGGFNIILWDDMGGSGDVTGQMTYDMFNQPLSNSLDGTIDPVTGLDACPITQQGAAAAKKGSLPPASRA